MIIIRNLFLSFFGLSVSASLVILPLLAVRPALNRRYASGWMHIIWMLLAVRLALPVHLPVGVLQTSGKFLADSLGLDAFQIPEKLVTPLSVWPSGQKGSRETESGLDGTASRGKQPDQGGERSAEGVSRTGQETAYTPLSGSDQDAASIQAFHAAPVIPDVLSDTTGSSAVKPVPGRAGQISGTADRGVRMTILDLISLLWFSVAVLFLMIHICSYLHFRRQVISLGKRPEDTDGQTGALLDVLWKELGIRRGLTVPH